MPGWAPLPQPADRPPSRVPRTVRCLASLSRIRERRCEKPCRFSPRLGEPAEGGRPPARALALGCAIPRVPPCSSERLEARPQASFPADLGRRPDPASQGGGHDTFPDAPAHTDAAPTRQRAFAVPSSPVVTPSQACSSSDGGTSVRAGEHGRRALLGGGYGVGRSSFRGRSLCGPGG